MAQAGPNARRVSDAARRGLRAARSAPAAGLAAAAEAAGVSAGVLRSAAVSTRRRGPAAVLAADAYLGGALPVRVAVISHRAIPPAVALCSARDRSWRVTSAVGGKAAWAPMNVRAGRGGRAGMVQRCTSQEWSHREGEALSEALPEAMLLRLVFGDSWMIATAAAGSAAARRRGLAHVVASAADSTLRSRAARYSNDVDLLARLCTDPDDWVRIAAAENPSTTPESLATLAGDCCAQTREMALANPAVPGEVLAAAVDGSEGERRAAAKNPSCPPAVLETLAGDVSGPTRRSVAKNLSVSCTVLRRLARDPARLVVCAVAQNPACPPDVLEELASGSEPDVRSAVARSPEPAPGEPAGAALRRRQLLGTGRCRMP